MNPETAAEDVAAPLIATGARPRVAILREQGVNGQVEMAAAFTRAGFKAPVLEDIRSEIWLKLWGNLSFNPISALTHATLEDICLFPPTRALAAQDDPDPNAGRRTYTPLSQISPNVLAATIAIEDKEYYNHPGFDIFALGRASRNAVLLIRAGTEFSRHGWRRRYRGRRT